MLSRKNIVKGVPLEKLLFWGKLGSVFLCRGVNNKGGVK